jgi:hypothetical protein
MERMSKQVAWGETKFAITDPPKSSSNLQGLKRKFEFGAK